MQRFFWKFENGDESNIIYLEHLHYKWELNWSKKGKTADAISASQYYKNRSVRHYDSIWKELISINCYQIKGNYKKVFKDYSKDFYISEEINPCYDSRVLKGI